MRGECFLSDDGYPVVAAESTHLMQNERGLNLIIFELLSSSHYCCWFCTCRRDVRGMLLVMSARSDHGVSVRAT